MFADGIAKRRRINRETLERQVQDAKSKKADPLFRYVIDLGRLF